MSSATLPARLAGLGLDGESRVALRRLAFALMVSVVIHSILLYGLRVRPGGAQGPPITVLSARLVAEDQELPAAAGDPAADSTVPLGIEGGSPTLPFLHRPSNSPERSASKKAVRMPLAPTVSNVASATGVRRAAALPEVAVPLPRDPTWYPAKQLDELPLALVPIQPKYTESGDGSSRKGRVVVLLLIDESGTVAEASVVEAAPEGYFERSALAAAREARFQPGSKGGRIVKSRVLLELRFGLPNEVGPR
ncbi:MAG: TonB family protein [Burkholderiales bacterium]